VANPGQGVSVSMARANWETGYFQAAVYRALLGELGYEVNDPGEKELNPADFYPALAGGDLDFWANGWFPLHNEFLSIQLPDGAVIGDRVERIGNELPAGGLQGFIVDIATAERLGVTKLADIGDDPAIAAVFDTDGDGKANLVGCNEGWGCQVSIEATLALNDWSQTIEQDSGDYGQQWDETVASYQRGDPILAYTWTPSSFVIELVAGEDVVWLSLDRSSEGEVEPVPLPPAQCPAQPCRMGFAAADINAVASQEFLAANPAAAVLLESVGFRLTDVALQNFRMSLGEDTAADVERHAQEWIAENRRLVDSWLDAARLAAAEAATPLR
jgi:glycine betaine/proline transport system substrate-binding protein